MSNSDSMIAHSALDVRSTGYTIADTRSSQNALVGVEFVGLLDMPTNTHTTVRGRGGFGASNQ